MAALDHHDWVAKYIDGRDEETHFEHRGRVVFEHPQLSKPITLLQEAVSKEKASGTAEDIEVFPATRLWPGGHRLATFLCENPDVVAGKRVLELGSGVGIVGLTAASLGAASVTVTDAHVVLLNENAALNELPNVCVRKLVWGDTKLEEEEPELILGSDIIYNQGPEVMAALASSLNYFAEKRATVGKATTMYLAYELRTDWESLKAFKAEARAAGFQITNVPTPDWSDDQMLLELTRS